MKRAPEMSDSARKKLVGEHLRNADKLLKTGDYDEALAEVEEGLTLEPGNFYAQAYKERIGALREKHGKPGGPSRATPAAPAPKSGLGSVPSPPPSAPARPAAADPGELSEDSGARIEELDQHETDELPEPAAIDDAAIETGRAVADLREQLDRKRATQEDETRRQTEELARQALERELRERDEAGRLRAAELEATTAALTAAPAEALARVVGKAAEAFEWRLGTGDLDGAFRELASIGIVEPGHHQLPGMTERLEAATLASIAPALGGPGSAPRDIPLQWYGRLLRAAWGEGKPNTAQAETLRAARLRFAVTPEEERELLAGIQREIDI